MTISGELKRKATPLKEESAAITGTMPSKTELPSGLLELLKDFKPD